MKTLTAILFAMSTLFITSCGGAEQEQEIEESYSLEISEKFNEDISSFKPTLAGAIYDDRRNQLQVYFTNYEELDYMFGYCCDKPKEDGQMNVSFMFPLNEEKTGIKAPEEGSCSYASKETAWGVNMVNKTMELKLVKLDDFMAEGSFHYKDTETGESAKGSFKVKLNKEAQQ